MLWGMMRAPTVPTARGRAALGSRGRTRPESKQHTAHTYAHAAQTVHTECRVWAIAMPGCAAVKTNGTVASCFSHKDNLTGSQLMLS